MVRFIYLISLTLLFFPAIGVVALKIAPKEIKTFPSVKRSGAFLFALQMANFLLLPISFLLIHHGLRSDFITLFTYFSLYAVDLISVVTIFLLPETCQADRVIGRLLQIYILLFLLLIVSGLVLSPMLQMINFL